MLNVYTTTTIGIYNLKNRIHLYTLVLSDSRYSVIDLTWTDNKQAMQAPYNVCYCFGLRKTRHFSFILLFFCELEFLCNVKLPILRFPKRNVFHEIGLCNKVIIAFKMKTLDLDSKYRKWILRSFLL